MHGAIVPNRDGAVQMMTEMNFTSIAYEQYASLPGSQNRKPHSSIE